MNAALINPFTDSTAIQPPAVEQPATASLTLPASGAVAEPFAAQLGATAAETAATDPGRAVAATLSHNKITQAVEIQSYAGSVEQSTRDNLDGPTPLLRSSEILGSGTSSCGGVEGHAEGGQSGRKARNVDPFDSETPNKGAGIKPGPQDHIHELEQLIGVAGKRRRRPLALPRFAPDFPELWKAMHDKTAPRTVLDPLWADASPIFLKG